MNRSRILAGIAAAAILLSGCSSSPKKEESTDKSEQVSEKKTDKTESTSQEKKEDQKESSKEAFTPQVIYDQNGVKVTATGYEDSYLGESLKLNVENNSEKNWAVQARDASVNGIMVNPIMSIDVAAGKKANGDMDILKSDLEDAGIESSGTIEFRLHLFNSDDWTDSVDSELITVKVGEDQSTDISNGEVLVDRNGLKIVSTGLKKDFYSDSAIGLYLENNSDQPMTVQVDNFSVNGYMLTAVFSCDVMPGKKASDEITLFSSDLEENGIEKVETVECSFRVFNSDNFATIFETGPIQINY